METTEYYAYFVPLYAMVISLESLVAQRRGKPKLSFAETFGNFQAGLGAIANGMFVGTAVYFLYDWGVKHLALLTWDEKSWWTWIVALLLADLAHYWHHRAEHSVAAFWAVHGVHHQAETLNSTVSIRHAWYSDLYSFPFFSICAFAGIPTIPFFVATTILSMHAFITHSTEYNFPSFGILVTPRTHTLHHALNERYLGKNFAAMFCIWDKVFGTHVEYDPQYEPFYGTFRGHETHDGAMAQFVLWRRLFKIAASAKTLRDKVKVFVSHPGWLPPGVEDPPPQKPRASVEIPLSTKLYTSLHFMGLMVFSFYIFIWRAKHPWSLRVVGVFLIFATLLSLGGLLDARRWAKQTEILRLCWAGLLGLCMFQYYPISGELGLYMMGIASAGCLWMLTGYHQNKPHSPLSPN